jgi:LmbE family N-acetylglucosaminyl deacetylase
MCVAAHPDDEDGSTLTILRRKYGMHTVSLFSTFGEGGQNAVGPELYEELGVIRARETMAAAEVQGSEPHFLGFKDFGFSKSAEETYAIWGEKEVLRRMVLQIRLLRPDVIITNHDTTSGHGHHQATGRTILPQFDAAADPKQFPEQLAQAGRGKCNDSFVASRGEQAAARKSSRSIQTKRIRARHYVRATSTRRTAQTRDAGTWPKTFPPAAHVRFVTARASSSELTRASANAKTPVDGLLCRKPSLQNSSRLRSKANR